MSAKKTPEMRAEAKQARRASFRRTFTSRAFRSGGYSVLAAVIVIAIAVGVVLAVSALPTKYTKYDLSSQQLYTLSEQTKGLVSSLDQDVNIYVLVVAGNEDATLDSLLERYGDLSDHIHISHVDPVKNPTFATQYTDSLKYNNSVVVTCGDKSRFVDYTDIYEYDYSTYYTTYDSNDISKSFNGEGALTSAIDYVTSTDLPILYALTGHGEADLTSAFQSALKQDNVEQQSLTLLTAGSVPDDCDCLLINSPASDISSEEKDQILTYLEAGGKLLLITNYTASGTEFPNLMALMEYYGCSLTDGIIIEQNADYYKYGYCDLLLPDPGSHDITTPISSAGMYVLVPDAQGITVQDGVRSTVTVTKLLTTSDSSFATTDMSNLTYKDGDVKGPFAVGVAIQENDTQIVWYSSGNIFNDTIDNYVSGANKDLFLNSIGWMSAREETVSIHAKSMAASSLSMTTRQATLFGTLMVIVIPLAVVVCGAVVLIRRRRK